MHFRSDIGQLQRLHDAIAITMDAIRRIAATSAELNGRTNGNAWIPAPPMETSSPANRARFEHSAWQPSWPMPPGQAARFHHSAWQPSWPSSAQPGSVTSTPWQDWPQGQVATSGWPASQASGWQESQSAGWPPAQPSGWQASQPAGWPPSQPSGWQASQPAGWPASQTSAWPLAYWGPVRPY